QNEAAKTLPVPGDPDLRYVFVLDITHIDTDAGKQRPSPEHGPLPIDDRDDGARHRMQRPEPARRGDGDQSLLGYASRRTQMRHGRSPDRHRASLVEN